MLFCVLSSILVGLMRGLRGGLCLCGRLGSRSIVRSVLISLCLLMVVCGRCLRLLICLMDIRRVCVLVLMVCFGILRRVLRGVRSMWSVNVLLLRSMREGKGCVVMSSIMRDVRVASFCSPHMMGGVNVEYCVHRQMLVLRYRVKDGVMMSHDYDVTKMSEVRDMVLDAIALAAEPVDGRV